MKSIKRSLALVLCMAILLSSLMITPVHAEYSGNCGANGDNVKWQLNTSTGVLTISGAGKMVDYASSTPWYSYRYKILKVSISYGVTNIGDGSFTQCYSLTSVSIPDGVTRIGKTAFDSCISLTSITLPYGVTSIGNSAFSNCRSLTSITIPDSVTSIGDSAFAGSGLTSITLPYGVTSIGNSAFRSCESLTSVSIPDSVTYIGMDPFYLDPVTYNEYGHCLYFGSVNNPYFALIRATTKEGYQYSCDIHPDTKVIAAYAFNGDDTFTSVTIPDSVVTIGDRAFAGCSRSTSVSIGKGVTTIGYCAFFGCKAQSLILPDSLESIDELAFAGWTNLSSIIIPDKVTKIGYATFDSCRSMTSVTIPENVTIIDNDAFKKCSALKSVYYKGSQEQWERIEKSSSRITEYGATVYFNSCDGAAEHQYNAFGRCTVCGALGGDIAPLGDLNNNGGVDSNDAALLRTAYLTWNRVTDVDAVLAVGDINGNKKLDSNDYILIRMKALGIIEQFPAK